MTVRDRQRLEGLFRNRARLQAALRREVRKAVKAQVAAGRPVIVWKDGAVVALGPHDASKLDAR